MQDIICPAYNTRTSQHIMLRGSSVLSHLQLLEGFVKRKRKVGAPKRTWMNDIKE